MSRRVCVTGGAGYIGSWLVKKLLDRGCTVHATLRNLGDEKKMELLKGLPGAAERLRLFEADIYDAATFEPAIQGCEFVFLVATPMMHDPSNTKAYVSNKALSGKELLKYNDNEYSSKAREFDVVVLLCGLVGGDTLLPYTPGSIHIILSPLTGVELYHTALKWMQALHGSVPLIHVDDICEAHIFCMEQSLSHLTGGRYLCAAAYPNMNDFVEHYTRKHPMVKLVKKEVIGEGVWVQANTKNLGDLGFEYKYGPEEVLDGSLECGKRLGLF